MKNYLTSTLYLLILLWFLPACAESNDTNDASAETVVSIAYTADTETTSAPNSAPDTAETAPDQSASSTTGSESTSAEANTNPAGESKPVQKSRQEQPDTKSTAAQPDTEQPAQPQPAATEQTQAPAPPDHGQWNQLLQQYVSASGKVNYTGLLEQQKQLEAYLDELAQATPGSDWSRSASLAYWLNVYNAFTVKLILDNWPVQSIKDTRGGTPFDDKWIELAGKKYSLNQIENEIIRPRFEDPRIHFAVNCAAVSCPPLPNRAFTADNVDRTLEQLARSFINNDKFNTITPERATVSKIFDWYRQDFGTLHEYLDRYAEASVTADTEIRFKEYDWGLNN